MPRVRGARRRSRGARRSWAVAAVAVSLIIGTGVLVANSYGPPQTQSLQTSAWVRWASGWGRGGYVMAPDPGQRATVNGTAAQLSLASSPAAERPAGDQQAVAGLVQAPAHAAVPVLPRPQAPPGAGVPELAQEVASRPWRPASSTATPTSTPAAGSTVTSTATPTATTTSDPTTTPTPSLTDDADGQFHRHGQLCPPPHDGHAHRHDDNSATHGHGDGHAHCHGDNSVTHAPRRQPPRRRPRRAQRRPPHPLPRPARQPRPGSLKRPARPGQAMPRPARPARSPAWPRTGLCRRWPAAARRPGPATRSASTVTAPAPPSRSGPRATALATSGCIRDGSR